MFYVNNASPRIAGTITQGTEFVKVEIASQAFDAVVDKAAQTWTVPAGLIAPALKDGLHEAKVIFFNAAGKRGKSVTAQMTVDTKAPVISDVKVEQQDLSVPANGHVDQTVVTFTSDDPGAAFKVAGPDQQAASVDHDSKGRFTAIFSTPLAKQTPIMILGADRAGNTVRVRARVPAGSVSINDVSAPGTLALTLADNTGISDGDNLTYNGQIELVDLDAGVRWFYSLDSGKHWTQGQGRRFSLDPGTYEWGKVRVYQQTPAGQPGPTSWIGWPRIIVDQGKDAKGADSDEATTETSPLASNRIDNPDTAEQAASDAQVTHSDTVFIGSLGVSEQLADTLSGTVAEIEAGQDVFLQVADSAGHIQSLTAIVDGDGHFQAGLDLESLDAGPISIKASATNQAGVTASAECLATIVQHNLLFNGELSRVPTHSPSLETHGFTSNGWRDSVDHQASVNHAAVNDYRQDWLTTHLGHHPARLTKTGTTGQAGHIHWKATAFGDDLSTTAPSCFNSASKVLAVNAATTNWYRFWRSEVKVKAGESYEFSFLFGLDESLPRVSIDGKLIQYSTEASLTGKFRASYTATVTKTIVLALDASLPASGNPLKGGNSMYQNIRFCRPKLLVNTQIDDTQACMTPVPVNQPAGLDLIGEENELAAWADPDKVVLMWDSLEDAGFKGKPAESGTRNDGPLETSTDRIGHPVRRSHKAFTNTARAM